MFPGCGRIPDEAIIKSILKSDSVASKYDATYREIDVTMLGDSLGLFSLV
jgi:hypothetical protein